MKIWIQSLDKAGMEVFSIISEGQLHKFKSVFQHAIYTSLSMPFTVNETPFKEGLSRIKVKTELKWNSYIANNTEENGWLPLLFLKVPDSSYQAVSFQEPDRSKEVLLQQILAEVSQFSLT